MLLVGESQTDILCQVSYTWSTRRVRGQHTATYQSTDRMGNVATQTATFTVN
jgi:hypothetical protein